MKFFSRRKSTPSQLFADLHDPLQADGASGLFPPIQTVKMNVAQQPGLARHSMIDLGTPVARKEKELPQLPTALPVSHPRGAVNSNIPASGQAEPLEHYAVPADFDWEPPAGITRVHSSKRHSDIILRESWRPELGSGAATVAQAQKPRDRVVSAAETFDFSVPKRKEKPRRTTELHGYASLSNTTNIDTKKGSTAPQFNPQPKPQSEIHLDVPGVSEHSDTASLASYESESSILPSPVLPQCESFTPQSHIMQVSKEHLRARMNHGRRNPSEATISGTDGTDGSSDTTPATSSSSVFSVARTGTSASLRTTSSANTFDVIKYYVNRDDVSPQIPKTQIMENRADIPPSGASDEPENDADSTIVIHKDIIPQREASQTPSPPTSRETSADYLSESTLPHTTEPAAEAEAEETAELIDEQGEANDITADAASTLQRGNSSSSKLAGFLEKIGLRNMYAAIDSQNGNPINTEPSQKTGKGRVTIDLTQEEEESAKERPYVFSPAERIVLARKLSSYSTASASSITSEDYVDPLSGTNPQDSSLERVKQQEQLAVFRQKMKKVTGSKTVPPSNPMGPIVIPDEPEDPDADIPLAILQAHNFPAAKRMSMTSTSTRVVLDPHVPTPPELKRRSMTTLSPPIPSNHPPPLTGRGLIGSIMPDSHAHMPKPRPQSLAVPPHGARRVSPHSTPALSMTQQHSPYMQHYASSIHSGGSGRVRMTKMAKRGTSPNPLMSPMMSSSTSTLHLAPGSPRIDREKVDYVRSQWEKKGYGCVTID